ncbi:hypothetical protein TNCV_4387041 [Trichonephila clavipes]|nr:hypothetical protein TNCV_4387041 [Trichonephila clavipes]
MLELSILSPSVDATASYSRAFGDEPRNFEPWSSDENDTSSNFPTTPMGGLLSLDIFNVHHPLHYGSSLIRSRTHDTPLARPLLFDNYAPVATGLLHH